MIDPIENAFDITPSNTENLTYTTRGIYVGTSGNLKVDTADGDTVTFVSLSAGVIHPMRVRRVYATGTTAGSIIGVY